MNNTSEQAKMLKDRDFGLIFAMIFLIISIWPLFYGGHLRVWSSVIVALFAVPAIFFPNVLNPLNRLWVKFGFFMHKIINPLLMGLVFFATVLPTGLILKLLGKDPMRRKFDENAQSYWISRTEQTLSKESFDNQF